VPHARVGPSWVLGHARDEWRGDQGEQYYERSHRSLLELGKAEEGRCGLSGHNQVRYIKPGKLCAISRSRVS